MKNILELQNAIDSLNLKLQHIQENNLKSMKVYYQHIPSNAKDSILINKNLSTSKDSVLEAQFRQKKELPKRIYKNASTRVKTILTQINSQERNVSYNQENIDKYAVEWHKKFAQAMACIVMFLIGAPLGAIIKKGGLGFPILISVIFFIIFYVISLLGEKWAKDGVVEPYIGMWIANFALFWVGLFFLRQAKNDSRLLEWDGFYIFTDRIGKVFRRKKKKTLDMSVKN